MEIFIDEAEREWKIGKPSLGNQIDKGGECVILPFSVDSMYPIDESDLNYSTCCKCGEAIESGLVCLFFIDRTWGVRICCDVHTKLNPIRRCKVQIVYIFDILKSIINKGCQTVYNGCSVCSRENCKDFQCKRILELEILEKDTLLDHFFNIKLDVLSPLVEPICETCKRLNAKKFCNRCKLYAFCGTKCKKEHTCNDEFYCIWRS